MCAGVALQQHVDCFASVLSVLSHLCLVCFHAVVSAISVALDGNRQAAGVTVRWIPTGECLGDIFTKNTIEAEQFFRLWHTLCGYKSWSVLEEITTKAAAIAIVVEGRYLTVTDMRACNAYASACHAQLRLIGDPHGGYYDEGRVWHPHVKAPAQATYGLGVGATTVVGPGGSRSRWASGSAPGAVSPALGLGLGEYPFVYFFCLKTAHPSGPLS